MSGGPPGAAGAEVAGRGVGPEHERYAVTESGVTDVELWLVRAERPEPYLQSTPHTRVVLALLRTMRPEGPRWE